MSANVIYVAGSQYILSKAIEKRLQDIDMSVISLHYDIDDIFKRRHDADIILFDMDETPQADRVFHYVMDLCRDEHKSLCLKGETFVIDRIRNSANLKQIAHIYESSVNIDKIIADIKALELSHKEFRRKKDILIVDDDDDFRAIMRLWLKNTYTVTGVGSGAEALELAEKEDFDLILLDYEMPEMDGYEVMGKLQRNPKTSSIPIIFLTGLNDRESVMRIIKHRPDGYVLKSTKKLELLDTLERFFAVTILGKNKDNL